MESDKIQTASDTDFFYIKCYIGCNIRIWKSCRESTNVAALTHQEFKQIIYVQTVIICLKLYIKHNVKSIINEIPVAAVAFLAVMRSVSC